MQSYERLECEFGKWADVGNTVACNSGTSALHLALEALEILQGSEVICPTLTMVACPISIVMAGLTPVFVDCTNDLNIDVELIEDAITDKTKAIMAVHIYGRPCNMEAIHELASKYQLYVIEDLAECHGLRPHDRTHVACWSFYRNKIIAGEEGGICTFHSPLAADIAKMLRSLGFTDAHDYTHIPRGHNYRLANCLADKILNSLRNYRENVIERNAIVEAYDKTCPNRWKMPHRYANWVYDLRIPGLTREQQNLVVAKLREVGVEARHAFKPMHTLGQFKQCLYYSGYCDKISGNYAYKNLADVVSREVIYLPIVPGVLPEDIAKLAFTTICKHV